MTVHTRISIVAIVVLAAGSSVTWASDPNESGIPLKFEIKSTAVGPLSPEIAGDPHAFGPWRPTYAAGIPWEGPTQYLQIVGSGPGAGGFTRFAVNREGLSTAQKEFLKATDGLLNAGRQGSPPQWYTADSGTEGPRQLLLYAMTLEDAQEMVETFVQFVMERWQREADTHRGYIKEYAGSTAAAEERIRELEKAIENSDQTLQSLKQRLPYRTEKEAMEAIAELDRMLNAAQVDIAGIQSRIKAVQEYLRSGELRLDEAIRAKLQAMFVEESIALQGAEARRKMATQLRTEANRFLDVQQSLASARQDKGGLQEKIVVNRKELSKWEHRLEQVMNNKPEIADHAIALYPVEWAAEYRMGVQGNR
jgi:hypothetical protein